MKRLFILFFVLFQTTHLLSQARFNRIYRVDPTQSLAARFHSLDVNNNKIYVAGIGNVRFDSAGYITHGFLTQLDITTGTVIKTNYYGRQLETSHYISKVMLMDKNSINLVGANFEGSITFIKTNFDGDILIRKKLYPTTYPTNYYGNTTSITKFGQGYAFSTFSAFSDNTPPKAAVVIVDTLGTITKSFDFEERGLNCGPTELTVNKNNNITLGTYATLNISTDTDYVNISQLREIDSSGRTLWKYSTPSNRYIFCDNFVQLANGNYLIWGTEEFSEVRGRYRTVYDGGPYLAEINPQRGLVWEKRFKLKGRLRCLKILKDSSIVMTGSYTDGAFSTSAFLIRLNSRRDSLYRRDFKTPDFTPGRITYFPNQIEELSNGDLVISGSLMNNIPLTNPTAGEWAWCVRTDNLGCSLEPSSCRVSTKDITQIPPLSINVFPNPVNDLMTIDYQFIEPQDKAYLEIADIVGRPVFQQKIDPTQGHIQWHTHAVATGFYIVYVKSGHQILWQTKVSVQK
jgi:Secretion system C-terminal sorting domain